VLEKQEIPPRPKTENGYSKKSGGEEGRHSKMEIFYNMDKTEEKQRDMMIL
jgi:hypothetical protein